MRPIRGVATTIVLAACLAGCASPSGDAVADERPGLARGPSADAAPDTSADRLRDEFAAALRLAAAATAADSFRHHLARANAQAAVFARAWSDSFLLGRAEWFAAISTPRRRASARADSLWRDGRVAFGREGVPAAMRLWRASLRVAVQAGDSVGRAVALGALGAGFYAAGGLDSAAEYLIRARRLAELAGDYRTLGNAMGNLGSVRKDLGDLSGAAQLYDSASTIRVRAGDLRGSASDQNNLGLIARTLGDRVAARHAFERALALNRGAGHARGTAINLANLADLASLEGDYQRATLAYEEALALNRAAGDSAEMAFVLHDLGLLAARRGDYPAAQASLAGALAMHERSGAAGEVAAVRIDLASVQAAMGDLTRAIATLSDAESANGGSGDSPTTRARRALVRGDLELQLGRPADADAHYAQAERWFREAGEPAGRADAQRGRGVLRMLRGDDSGALDLLEQAARGLAGRSDRREAATTRLLIAGARESTGDTAGARREIITALSALAELGDPAGEAAALSALGDLESRAGSPLAAESRYRQGLARLGSRPMPDLRWRLHAGLGVSLAGRRALEPAAQHLQAAMAAVEQVAGTLQPGERRAGFLADKWDVYASLARVEEQRGRPGDAFAASERMRARQLTELAGRGRVAARGAAATREQDLRRRIAELTREIEGDQPEAGNRRERARESAGTAIALEALDAAHRAYAGLLEELRASDPRHAALVSASPPDWRAVSARLRPDELFLEYLVADSATMVFAITSDSIAVLDLGVTRHDLARLLDFTRNALERPGGDGPGLLWRTPLRRLYRMLLEPVEHAGMLEGRRTLIIVPHAELHFLPFAALIAPGAPEQYLVERYQLEHTPSAGLWTRTGSPVRRGGQVLALAPSASRLPASADEMAGIRRIYGRRARVLTGAAATETALRAEAPRRDILHIAGFGVLNRHNPLFSHVELAPGPGSDGRLEVHEVFSLQLGGQLVVLSACQTALASGARTDVPPGDDWVGLVQSFLQAGAGAVLASLWRVEDAATARLMQEFHRRLAAAGTPAVALAGAQRTLLHRPATAHPFYWAGFVLNNSRSE